jgi:hypothetical protein
VQSFTNDFSFQLTNANADGFTFTIQGNSPTALGGRWESWGYGTNSNGTIPGIGSSVAVGFQLYSTVLGNTAVSLTGDWTNGASAAATPGTSTTGSGVNLHSGDVMNLHMTYGTGCDADLQSGRGNVQLRSDGHDFRHDHRSGHLLHLPWLNISDRHYFGELD